MDESIVVVDAAGVIALHGIVQQFDWSWRSRSLIGSLLPLDPERCLVTRDDVERTRRGACSLRCSLLRR